MHTAFVYLKLICSRLCKPCCQAENTYLSSLILGNLPVTSLVDTLHHRASHAANTLVDPAPSAEQLADIISCAMSAPDHGKLRPWRFVVITGEARHRLGEALSIAATEADNAVTAEKKSMIKSKPLRSPMIIACVTEITENQPKVPVFEQILSTGAAIQQLQLGANDLGFGCAWLSGPFCNATPVKELLQAAEKDLVAGFVYIGTPSHPAPQKPRPKAADHMVYLDK